MIADPQLAAAALLAALATLAAGIGAVLAVALLARLSGRTLLALALTEAAVLGAAVVLMR